MTITGQVAPSGKKSFAELDFVGLCDRLAEKKATLVIFHAHPDGDAVGSAFSLSLLLGAAGSPTFCVCADEVPRRYVFAVEGLQSGVLPENLPGNFKYERIISVDTPSTSQMGRLAALFEDKIDIMIDHHSRGEIYADNYIDPSAAATGEIIYDISREFLRRGLIKIIPERFFLLAYIAIATDTGCFCYSNTTPATHMRAADLMCGGSFDYVDVNYRLFAAKTQEELKITRAALENIQYFGSGEISVVSLDFGQKTALGVPDEYLDILIDVARSVEGVKVAVSVKQLGPDNTYRASLRSNCEVDVSAVCARFGGGGHKKAAGCTVSAKSMSEAIGMLVEEIRREL
ncbi:MAG TPA: hypothetical protein GX011_06595 [Clostridiales bacterium]|jgi:phosphoesterase RecJ-like protein|nr:hypothetical protein [Clostridiales bacterium]